jgi:hypothetical protein
LSSADDLACTPHLRRRSTHCKHVEQACSLMHVACACASQQDTVLRTEPGAWQGTAVDNVVHQSMNHLYPCSLHATPRYAVAFPDKVAQ